MNRAFCRAVYIHPISSFTGRINWVAIESNENSRLKEKPPIRDDRMGMENTVGHADSEQSRPSGTL